MDTCLADPVLSSSPMEIEKVVAAESATTAVTVRFGDSGADWYVYCGNNPVNRIDPTGLVDVDLMLLGREQIRQGQVLQAIGWITVGATILEDVLSGGAGILDDALTVARGMSTVKKGKEFESTGRENLEAGVTAGNTPDASTNNAERVRDIFAGLEQGNNPGKSIAQSEAELKTLFNRMAEGGTFIDRGRYSGVAVELPDGTQIGYRTISVSGGPTIDIQYTDEKSLYKVHIDEY